LLGISRNYVSMIEGGKKPFSDKLRRKLSKVSEEKNAPVTVTFEDPEKGVRESHPSLYPERVTRENKCPFCSQKDSEIAFLRDLLTRCQANFSAALAAIERHKKG